MVPEERAPGESQSNGDAERAVHMLEDKVRVLKLALEHGLGVNIPMGHAVMHWLIQHTSLVLTNYDPGSDEHRTGHERVHGDACTARMPEFGEATMWYLPKAIRHKVDPR